MEKVLNSMPGSEGQVKADRVLELNPSHPVFTTLQKLYAEDKDRVKAYAGLLYAQAVLIEGMSLEDPVAPFLLYQNINWNETKTNLDEPYIAIALLPFWGIPEIRCPTSNTYKIF